MSIELRAAATRFAEWDVKARRHKGTTGYELPYGHLIKDVFDLARAYLAEYPADDAEPLTLEWALTQGCREPDDVDASAPPTVTIPGCRHGVLVQASPREWHWCRGSKVIATVRTRRDFRRLVTIFTVN